MAATLHEVLDGLGAWQFDLKTWDDDLAKECKKGRILLVSEGERAAAALLILTRSPTEAKPSIGGQFPDWRLGAGDTGPLIEAREYVAGTDKLANGTFSLGELYYRFGQDTLWIIADAGPATTTGDRNVDDLLESDETFLTAPGRQYRLTILSKRNGGTVGRLRGRVLFEGRFDTPNLLMNGNLALGAGHGWSTATDIAIVTDPDDPAEFAMRVGPSTQPDALAGVGGFEDAGVLLSMASNTGLAVVSSVVNDPTRARTGDYVLLVGTSRKRAAFGGDMEAWTGGLPHGWGDASGPDWDQSSTNRGGNYSLRETAAGGQSAIYGLSPAEWVGIAGPHGTPVMVGERWQFVGYVLADIGTPTDGEAWCEVWLVHVGGATLDNAVSEKAQAAATGATWRQIRIDVDVPLDVDVLQAVLSVDSTMGFWYFDDFAFERVEGNEETIEFPAVTVTPGEEWTPLLYARSGLAFISGGLFPRVRVTGSGKPDVIHELTALSQTGHEWFISGEPVTIEDGYDTAYLELHGRDISGEWIYVDDCSFVRTKGNIALLSHDSVVVTPGRSYRFIADVELDATLAAGEVAAVARFTGSGRNDVIVESSPIKVGDAARAIFFDIAPPSGYDGLVLSIKGTDIVGGSFWVRDMALTDQDGITVVSDLVLSDPVLGTHTLEVTAPAGAEKVRVQLVAESLGGGWEVDEVHFQRIGVTPATVASIVADLLRHPDFGEQLLRLGTIHGGSDVITHDWEFTNLHNLEALVHLLFGGVAPTLREYRVNSDLTVDVGEAADLYESRPDLVLSYPDLVLLEPVDLTEDATTYTSHIKVIGAQRQKANGDTITITATAAVPWATPLLNDDGTPVVRTRVVTDSSVNHPLYAKQFAEFLADREADTEQAVSLKLSETRARGDFAVGDWIYSYVPEAGLLDETNEMLTAKGEVVFPKKSRVIDRTMRLGAGYKAEIIREDGSVFDLTDYVLWEPVTSSDITVGSLRPSFTTDDQGGAAFTQLRRFIASPAH